MGNNKDVQRDKKEQPPQAGRKNNEEVGEPIQLDDDKSQKQDQQGKPGQREGEQGGQEKGGGQPGGKR